MRKIVTFIFFCCLFDISFSQIPNAGFESWTGGNPDGWFTSNITVANITQSSIRHLGSSAVRGEVVSLGFGAVIQPVLVFGQEDARGFAYNQRPISFTGYYQFYPISGDLFNGTVILYKGGIEGIAVASGDLEISAAASSYTQFSATFNYLTNDIPDTCFIHFRISGSDVLQPYGNVGSYFLLDDLAFSGSTAVDKPNTVKPEAFLLSQNYPNPFNPSTSIQFSLQKGSHVILRVFNILGKEVATLVNGYRETGQYVEKFDAATLSSGVYFYRLDTEGYTSMKQMLLVK
jgi:hypothetical protein